MSVIFSLTQRFRALVIFCDISVSFPFFRRPDCDVSVLFQFFREPEALETLLNLLDLYSRRTASSSGSSPGQSEAGEAGDAAATDPSALSGTPEDVIVKVGPSSDDSPGRVVVR